jgi:hypothetical protein
MKKEIDDARLVVPTEQATIELLHPRPDAGERGECGK